MNEIIDSKDHIDFIIFLIKSDIYRLFFKLVKEFIKEPIQYDNIEIIFSSNIFGKEEESEEFYKNQVNVKNECLKKFNERYNIKPKVSKKGKIK
jgi:hypothetical protein